MNDTLFNCEKGNLATRKTKKLALIICIRKMVAILNFIVRDRVK